MAHINKDCSAGTCGLYVCINCGCECCNHKQCQCYDIVNIPDDFEGLD